MKDQFVVSLWFGHTQQAIQESLDDAISGNAVHQQFVVAVPNLLQTLRCLGLDNLLGYLLLYELLPLLRVDLCVTTQHATLDLGRLQAQDRLS